MSAPTGVDASLFELAAHAELKAAESKARRCHDGAVTDVDDLERDLKQAKLDLEAAAKGLEASEQAREQWLDIYWARRGGEPGR